MKLLRRFLVMAKSHWNELFITVVSLILAAVLNLVTPEIVRRLTALLQTPQNITLNILLVYAVILIVAYLFRALFRFISMWVSHIAAWDFVGELTLMVYDKFQKLSLSYYKDKQTGELMSRMINDTRLLEVLIAHAVPDLLTNLILVLGVAVVIFIINPTLALITLIPVPFVIWASMQFGKRVSPLFQINQRVLGELSGVLQDNMSGMTEIQSFANEKSEHERLAKMCKHYSFVNIRANFANGVFNPAVEFLTSIGTVIVVVVGGYLAMGGNMPTSDIIGFIMYLNLFYQPLAILARLVEDVQNAYAGASRVFEVLDADIDIHDEPDAKDIGRTKGNIQFENVSFCYEDGISVLKDVTFEARSGQMIALVGPTGVGKTTIVSLIERFYDPVQGRILIDGQDIKHATLESLRTNISMVLQDVFLFNGTIGENIAYAMPNATKEDIIKAAKTAHAHDFIEVMPNGYDTQVGERGLKLSGGQKQRIAIARAVLRNSPILILDEATAAVDNETEAEIQAAIEELAGSRTIIVIAHRLSTVKRANNIIVLDNCEIVESGTHDELLESGGLYAKLQNKQG